MAAVPMISDAEYARARARFKARPLRERVAIYITSLKYLVPRRHRPKIAKAWREIGWKLHEWTWVFRRVWHVLQWLPVLWRDADFDAAYLVRLMQFKMRRMADHFEKHQIVRDADRMARELRITAAHFDRYLESHTYGPPYPIKGRDPLEFEEIPDRKGYRRLKQLEPRDAARVKRWCKQHEMIENENWNAALEMIRKRGRGWWD